MNIGFLSYSLGALAFLLLSVLIFVSWRGRELGALLFSASLVSTLWAAVLAFQSYTLSLPSYLVFTVEIARIGVWLAFIQRLLGLAVHPEHGHFGLFKKLTVLGYGLIASLLVIEWGWARIATILPDFIDPSLKNIGYVILALTGMVLIEQLYRNSRPDQRWAIKFMCFAIGGLFAYDFYLYSDALLFRRINPDLWMARGAVLVLCVPLITISAARSPDWSVDLFISRGMIFHTATLLGAGLYLLLMSFAGYYIRTYGGSWGAVAQIVFLVGAFMVLALLLFSGQIRSWFRVFLSKHFFSYAYDYRQEWLGIIARLSETDSGLPLRQRVILALSSLVESPSGVLWIRENQDQLLKRADFGDPEIDLGKIDAGDPLARFIAKHRSVINLNELDRVPELYPGLERPAWLDPYPNAWVLVPLFQGNELYGLVLLTTPRTTIDWNWEVIDILKTAGIQAASYLALEDAVSALFEARQFEGFNRLSAFVIHDLKNVIAQLTLVVRNAERHKDNPEFMADAIKTIEHSVDKMNRLMSQLKNAGPAGSSRELSVKDVLLSVIRSRARQKPKPAIDLLDDANPIVRADEDRLYSAFEHIIQNAQEAAGKSGTVRVTLQSGQNTAIVEVKDSGHGMDEPFIRSRLFKPFDTTKGLTGMGIGAYESREYIRSLGGELNVISKVGAGSVFQYQIPVLFSENPNISFAEGESI
ncbi:MAG: PEP-CTERM system histidine kinase PrsK [Methylococcaceae bacterium]|nr:PEP-CTERM system histidine kinase PrsK [Methylococcaceae bacterium]MCI0732270.1 PEP-CTERM system histidine kinase PrsK [Methylococcaceae bacterium]